MNILTNKFFIILYSLTIFISGCGNEKNNLELCLKKNSSLAAVITNKNALNNEDVIEVFNYISNNCSASNLSSHESQILIKSITKNVDNEDFAYIYSKLNDVNQKVRMALIESSDTLSSNYQKKLNIGNAYRLIEPWNISNDDVKSDIKLEGIDDADLDVREAVTIDGKKIYYKFHSENGTHGGQDIISFWNKENGKSISNRFGVFESFDNSINLSSWSENSELHDGASAIIDNKGRLFGIISATEINNSRNKNQPTSSENCEIRIYLYKIEEVILENYIGNFNCSEDYFNADGLLAQPLWDAVIAEASQKTKFPSYIYYLIDTNRCDDSDIALVKKISSLDGFNANRISELFRHKFSFIKSKPTLDDYNKRKIDLNKQKSCHATIAKTLGLQSTLTSNTPGFDMDALESKIDDLALKVSNNKTDYTDNYIGRLDVMINKQFPEKSFNTKAGTFSYAYEAFVIDGKLIFLVSNKPEFSSRGYTRVPVEEIDKSRTNKNEQLGGFTVDVPVFKIISESELSEKRGLINKSKLDIDLLDNLIDEYIRKSHYVDYSFF